jgi:small subunit ribosomal protein S16
MRLTRRGKKKQPVYRLVIAEASTPRDGKEVEVLGYYNPRTEPVTLNIDTERVTYWLGVGVQMTDPVQRLLANQGLVPKKERKCAEHGVSKKEKKARAGA